MLRRILRLRVGISAAPSALPEFVVCSRAPSCCAQFFSWSAQALIGLRENDEIGDDVLRRLLRETDLRKRAGEGDASPGAPPPNP